MLSLLQHYKVTKLKKQNLLYILILISAVFLTTVETFASTSVVQTLSVSAQPTVAIEKTSSVQTGQINPENGAHSGLNASFILQTNGTDDDYTFIVGSKITSYGNEEVSAYSNDGQYLLFGRYGEEEYLPKLDAIENAKAGGNNNPNVIAYPITLMEVTSPMTIQYDASQDTGENTVGCYVVKINSATEGTLRQTIGGNPLQSTYSISQDMAGQYKAVVYFTAISK